jgi:hypothetical protein
LFGPPTTLTLFPPTVTCACATGSVITYPAPINTEARTRLMPAWRAPREVRVIAERLAVVIWTLFLDK